MENENPSIQAKLSSASGYEGHWEKSLLSTKPQVCTYLDIYGHSFAPGMLLRHNATTPTIQTKTNHNSESLFYIARMNNISKQWSNPGQRTHFRHRSRGPQETPPGG